MTQKQFTDEVQSVTRNVAPLLPLPPVVPEAPRGGPEPGVSRVRSRMCVSLPGWSLSVVTDGQSRTVLRCVETWKKQFLKSGVP